MILRLGGVIAGSLLLLAQPGAAANGPDVHARLADAEARLAVIAARLAIGNAAWCPDRAATPGWLLGDARLYDGDGWPAARGVYGAGQADAPFVAALDPGGAAAAAGLRRGDAVLAIGGHPLDSAPTDDRHARLARADALLRIQPLGAPVALTVADAVGGPPRTVLLAAPTGCASEFRIEARDRISAAADGRVVLVSLGLTALTADDEQLAAVVAHELAHNILRHRVRLDAAGLRRGLAMQFGRNARLVRSVEDEAGRLSVWLLAGAGYEPQAAARFWQAHGRRVAGLMLIATTHARPGTRAELVTAEIAALTAARAADPAAVPGWAVEPGPLAP